MKAAKVAVVVGAGPGLGFALAQRFAHSEMSVALVARNAARLDGLASACCGIVHAAHPYTCDATDEAAVDQLFAAVEADLGTPQLVVYNAGAYVPGSILETSAAEFERCWRVGCLGGFLVGRAAARAMLARVEQGGEGGTILFTGATASLRGSAGFHNLAVGKAGLRSLSQSMARELGPRGIHVAHIVIDGRIGPAGGEASATLLDPAAIADAYYQLHCQPRSAWTQELDLRPWSEKF